MSMQKHNLSVKIDRELMERLVEAAELHGTTLDAFVTSTLRTKLRDRDRDATTQRLLEWTDSQI